jgi:hypothetical protein
MLDLTKVMQNVGSAADEIGPWLNSLEEAGDPILASQYRERLFKVFSKHAASLENHKSRTVSLLDHAMQLRATALEFMCHTKTSNTDYIAEQALSCAVQYERADLSNEPPRDKSRVICSFYARVFDALDQRQETDDKENRPHVECSQAMHAEPAPLKWAEVGAVISSC